APRARARRVHAALSADRRSHDRRRNRRGSAATLEPSDARADRAESVRRACAQCREWERAGLPPLRLAVNISPRQFQSVSLADVVAAVLADAGLAAERLELEL